MPGSEPSGRKGIGMYAVIRAGGKQQRVEKGETVRVERISAAVGDRVDLGEVLFVRKGSTLKVGQPLVPGAKVEAVVVEHGLGDKVIVFKKKRRKQYRRTRGHRQMFTALRIDKITMAAASKPTEASAKKPESA
ncbi:MAG: 50S ribosomal protein L21 [Acidobacteriota bacterium]